MGFPKESSAALPFGNPRGSYPMGEDKLDSAQTLNVVIPGEAAVIADSGVKDLKAIPANAGMAFIND